MSVHARSTFLKNISVGWAFLSTTLLHKYGHTQRFVSSIGNIEKAVWVFNCLGRPAVFGSTEKNIGGPIMSNFWRQFFYVFMDIFFKHFSVHTKNMCNISFIKKYLTAWLLYNDFGSSTPWPSKLFWRRWVDDFAWKTYTVGLKSLLGFDCSFMQLGFH